MAGAGRSPDGFGQSPAWPVGESRRNPMRKKPKDVRKAEPKPRALGKRTSGDEGNRKRRAIGRETPSERAVSVPRGIGT